MRVKSVCAVIVAWLNAFHKSRGGVGMTRSVSVEVISVLSGLADDIARYVRTCLTLTIQQW